MKSQEHLKRMKEAFEKQDAEAFLKAFNDCKADGWHVTLNFSRTKPDEEVKEEENETAEGD